MEYVFLPGLYSWGRKWIDFLNKQIVIERIKTTFMNSKGLVRQRKLLCQTRFLAILTKTPSNYQTNTSNIRQAWSRKTVLLIPIVLFQRIGNCVGRYWPYMVHFRIEIPCFPHLNGIRAEVFSGIVRNSF